MTEAAEQREVIKWFRETYPSYSRSIRLSLNGINLGSGRKAAIMVNHIKAQGMTKGESDLAFLIPSKGFHGMLLEFKSADDKRGPTQEQMDYIDYMNTIGYFAVLAKGQREAKALIAEYMSGVRSTVN